MKTVRIAGHTRTKHLYILASILFVAIVGMFGFTLTKVSPSTTPLSNISHETKAEAGVPAKLGTPVDSMGAREIAQAQNPDSTVAKVETVPTPNGATTYNVVFTDGSSVRVDGADGAVIKDKDPEQATAPDTSTTEQPPDTKPADPPTDEPTDKPADPPAEPPSDTPPNDNM